MRLLKTIHWFVALAVTSALISQIAHSASTNSSEAIPEHAIIHVQAGASLPSNLSGRLLIFLKKGSGDHEVDSNPMEMDKTWIAATDVANLNPGQFVSLDADGSAFPTGFSTLPAGKYEMQAVLDVDRNYNYKDRNASDWISDVVNVNWKPGAKFPALTLKAHATDNPEMVARQQAALAKVRPEEIRQEHFTSPVLTRFHGIKKQINAWIILPPHYGDNEQITYPTVYWTHGFSGDFDKSLGLGIKLRERMVSGQIPPMIWVMLDESIPQGTHEFADSVNNGPWGTALTTEFIPYLEQHYRMDRKVTGRLLTGHSSGGWATLQLQINYPKVFGGTWSTSPDSSDFHDFTGPDLYADRANIYYRADGSEYPIIRDQGKILGTMHQYARREFVLGPYGGQITSFDWVFSPKADNGGPMNMFDHETGTVNPDVVAYWREHYDLANIVKRNWTTRGNDLRGRIHLIIGTADTFYLDGGAHKMQNVLDALHADAQFRFLPDRTHFDLFQIGDDKLGLMNQITKEMYAVARPGISLTNPLSK